LFKEYLKNSVTREALYGRYKFPIPKTVGKVEATFLSHRQFVNCTFVTGPFGPHVIFCEHVLKATNPIEEAQKIRVTYSDQTSDDYLVRDCKLVAVDLMAVPLSKTKCGHQALAKLEVQDDDPQEIYLATYDTVDSTDLSVSQGRLFDVYHSAASVPGNCSAPLYTARNTVVAFHCGAMDAERINVCIPVTAKMLASLGSKNF
jgi:hypothetical protein